jgi:hypothetical protein
MLVKKTWKRLVKKTMIASLREEIRENKEREESFIYVKL